MTQFLSKHAPTSTTTMAIRFSLVGTDCRIGYRWPDDLPGVWTDFGDPVPVFEDGPRAGFHVHDLYHLTLLAETGWSAVLAILLVGARGGVFGGVDALAEEAVVLDHHLSGVDGERAVKMLGYAVDDPYAIARAFGRGDALRYEALRQLARHRQATVCVDDVPRAFAQRARAWRSQTRTPVERRRRPRSARGIRARAPERGSGPATWIAPAGYPSAARTASVHASGVGKPSSVLRATTSPSTHTVNSPRSPGSITVFVPSAPSISAAARAALGS